MKTPFEFTLASLLIFGLLTLTFYLAISRLSRDYEKLKKQPWFADHRGLPASNVLFYSRKNRYLLAIILGLIGFFIGLRIGGGLSGGLLGGFICYTIPQLTLKHSAWKHRNILEKQIARALLQISHAIKDGKTVYEALKQTSKIAPSDMKQELHVIAKQLEAGISLEKALEGWETRIQRPRTSAAVRMLCAAIRSHADLSDAFAFASKTIVEHARLDVENKLSLLQLRVRALLLSLIPLVCFFGIYFVNASYLQPLLTTPMGWASLSIIAFMQLMTYRLIVSHESL